MIKRDPTRGWEGLLPFSKALYESTYFLPNEDYYGWLDRVTDAYANDREHKERMKTYIWNYWGHPSTPISSNAGTTRGLPISCFVKSIDDTRESIFDGYMESFWLASQGGGVGTCWSKVREVNAQVGPYGGTSSGVIPFLGITDRSTLAISQGNLRRGSEAVYLHVSHPEIEEFIDLRKPTGDLNRRCPNLHHAVVIPDSFMIAVEERASWDLVSPHTGKVVKTVDAFDLWCRILDVRATLKGEPYLLFIDTVNRMSPQEYKDNGVLVETSQLCISGNDRVVTSKGYLTAKELHDLDEELELFDGEKLVKASKMLLRERNVPTYRITLDNGMEHTVTGYHGVMITDGKKTLRKECKDLEIGDKVLVQNKKGLFGPLDMPKEAFLLGLYQSDGTQHKDMIMLDVWENDFDLLDEIQEAFNHVHYSYGCDTYRNSTRKIVAPKFYECNTGQSTVRKMRLGSKTLKQALNFEKGYVPSWIWEATENTQWQYVRGLLYADGTVHKSASTGDPIQINYADINLEFLKELQILFQNLGLHTSIRLLREAGESLLPDGKGGHKFYKTKTAYRLIIGNKPDAIEVNKNTGFLDRKGVFVEDREYRDNVKKSYAVVSVEEVGTEDVYCPTVYTDEHVFVSQGIITCNCNEITLETSNTKTAVCCLGSLNVEYYDEYSENLNQVVADWTDFLDNVLQDFIDRTEHMPGFAKARFAAMDERSLGLGVMGFHSYLQSRSIPWESALAAGVNNKIFSNIKQAVDQHQLNINAPCPMASRVGSHKRNIHVTAVAPTLSISNLCNVTSSGIEPIMANSFVQKVKTGSFTVTNKYLKAKLQELGQDTQEVWESIKRNDGSVQHLEFLDQWTKDVFKTAYEIDQRWLIDHGGDRQQFIDQSQSLNLFIPGNSHVAYIYDVHMRAWKKGLKGLYYLRSTAGTRGNTGSAERKTIGNDECLSCQ